MARRRLSEGQKWQIIGMKNAGLSCRDIGTRLGVNHTVISRLVQKHGLTGQVKDRPRSGRPRKTSARDDRALGTLGFGCRRQRSGEGLKPSDYEHVDQLDDRS